MSEHLHGSSAWDFASDCRLGRVSCTLGVRRSYRAYIYTLALAVVHLGRCPIISKQETMSSANTYPREHDYKNGVKSLPLDPSLWSELNEEDLSFLRVIISSDDAVIRRKVDEVQKE